MRCAWTAERLSSLTVPVPVESTGQTGFGPRLFSVVFSPPQSGAASSSRGTVHTGVQVATRMSRRRRDSAETPMGQIIGDRAASPAYFERQVDAWCGMHALNNFLGGPYVTWDACRRAASRVSAALSEVGAGDREAGVRHLDPSTGWLSIDVINVLGAGQLGLHVEGDAVSFAELQDHTEASALVNCNNGHWTVLQRCMQGGPWIHINSIVGPASYHGRMETLLEIDMEFVLDGLRGQYGSISLHRIVRSAVQGGHHFLEAAGMRAMLPAEERLCADVVQYADR